MPFPNQGPMMPPPLRRSEYFSRTHQHEVDVWFSISTLQPKVRGGTANMGPDDHYPRQLYQGFTPQKEVEAPTEARCPVVPTLSPAATDPHFRLDFGAAAGCGASQST
ncbi:hypothetical protein Vafri_2154 [Volvox africanus]|nr:hypothetical protein Vafri_2154 [Volvox africanus]